MVVVRARSLFGEVALAMVAAKDRLCVKGGGRAKARTRERSEKSIIRWKMAGLMVVNERDRRRHGLHQSGIVAV